MRGLVNDLKVSSPRTLAEALRLLADPKNDGMRPLAGGTDLMVLLNEGVLQGEHFLDLSGIAALRRIKVEQRKVIIGATATYQSIQDEATVRRRFPTLIESSRWTGALQIQARGTLGGNIANASPAADSVPVLVALGAVLHLAKKGRKRAVPIDEFFLGYKKTALEPGELITAIELPNAPPRSKQYFRKVGTRNAQSISRVMMAGVIQRDADRVVQYARLAIGSVGPTVVRLTAVEDALLGKKLTAATRRKAKAALDATIVPLDDIRATADYRRFAAHGCLDQILTESESTAPADWKNPFKQL
jgi:CO/xanthine dehydrogenase FAD-binding subunit